MGVEIISLSFVCMCVCVPVGVWGRMDTPQVFQNNLS